MYRGHNCLPELSPWAHTHTHRLRIEPCKVNTGSKDMEDPGASSLQGPPVHYPFLASHGQHLGDSSQEGDRAQGRGLHVVPHRVRQDDHTALSFLQLLGSLHGHSHGAA